MSLSRSLVVLLLLSVGGAFAGADPAATPAPASSVPVAADCDHVPAGFDGCAMQWTAYAGTERLLKVGADRVAIAFSSVQVDVLGPLGSHIFGRGELSARPTDDSAVADPSSWTSGELWGGVYRRVAPGLSLAGLCGVAVPLDQTPDATMERSCGGGLFLGEPRSRRWLFAGAVRIHTSPRPATDPAATSPAPAPSSTPDRNAGLFGVQFPLKDSTSFRADATVLGSGSYAHVGVAVKVGH